MNWLRNNWINYITKNLFNGITEDDILAVKADGVYLKDKKLTEEQIVLLSEDAEKFANSVIWKFLTDDAKYQANYLMYQQSQSYEGMMFGKALLYLIDIMQKKIEQLKKLK